MTENHPGTDPTKPVKRFGCLQVFGLIVLAGVIAAGATFFILKAYLFPSGFNPVTLSTTEEKALSEKLEDLDSLGSGNGQHGRDADGRESGSGPAAAPMPLEPEPYSENGLKRGVAFTERELNALLAKNTSLADKLVIDLSDNLISAKLRLPLDEDLPILGGQIIRLRSGVEMSFRDGKPVVVLKGVTVMGVPLPNAWLGGIKNMDLVETFGDDTGFWKLFSDGIEDIRVEKGLLRVTLKE